jgi:hypothetical protein
MIEIDLLWFAIGNITGSTFMFGTYYWYIKYNRKKAMEKLEIMGENFQDMSEEDLKLDD